MLQQELLTQVLDVLHLEKIEYMITGSLVSSIQGEPRTTHDIDILINIKPVDVSTLMVAFSKDRFYIDGDAIRDAMKHQGMFNLIDTLSGDKVDFWVLTSTPFDLSRFSRKIQITILGMSMYISSPEDTILMKLHWSKLSGGSTKQSNDALRVYELQYRFLDLPYINDWVKKLDLNQQWKDLLSDADPLI
jgi:hypothetical protein